MTIYYKISPDHTKILEVQEFPKPLEDGEFNSRDTSFFNGKPYLIEVTVEPKPAHDPTTQRLRHVDTWDGTSAIRTWEIVDLPPPPTARERLQSRLDGDPEYGALALVVRDVKGVTDEAFLDELEAKVREV